MNTIASHNWLGYLFNLERLSNSLVTSLGKKITGEDYSRFGLFYQSIRHICFGGKGFFERVLELCFSVGGLQIHFPPFSVLEIDKILVMNQFERYPDFG